VNDWVRAVENLRRLLRERPSSPDDNSDISSFEALEQEISNTVEALHVERLEKNILSLAERARTPESLEKIADGIRENFRDAIEKKQAEIQLGNQGRFLNQLLDGSTDGILAFDIDGAVIFCNPALERFLGITQEKAIGKNLLEELPYFKELGENPFVLEALAGKTVTSRNRPFRIPGSNGNLLFDACYSPVSGESNEVLGGVVILRDVTDLREIERALHEAREELHKRMQEHTAARNQMHKQLARNVADLSGMEKALQESEDRFRRLVENLAEDIITINCDGKLTFLNRPWPGAAEEKGVTADFYQFIGSEHHDTFRNCLERVFQTAEVERFEITTLQGKRYENCLVPLVRDESVVAGMLIANEITAKIEEGERQGKQAPIQHSQEIESSAALAGGIARGYDEMLTDLLGHVGSVLEDIPPDSPARYSLEQIEVIALRATELTRPLQAYSGEITPGDQTLHLGRLVEEMKESLERVVSPKASLEIQVSAHTSPIRSDAGQIRQLILNLVKNASEALGEKKGLITLTTGVMKADRVDLSESLLGEKLPEGFYAYLEVTDTGEGMDEETLAKFYVPFFTTKPGRYGLGLATVVGTALVHDGAIRVTSLPQRGTTVRVLLPRADPSGELHVED
jgi:PAS domain S-box-containing protein